jgi:hypothetical protein
MDVQIRFATHHLVGRYPGWQSDLHHLPKHLFQSAQWLSMKAGHEARLLTVAGAAQVYLDPGGLILLLPVELQTMNQFASTNMLMLALTNRLLER